LITRPSISDLLTGLTRNFERQSASPDNGTRQLLIPALTVLDRLSHEWSSWCALLEEDNADIRATLERLGVNVSRQPDPSAALASRAAITAVDALEAENRRLKEVLVTAIENFDLPATDGASAAARAADREVLRLLQRLLHRENRVPVAPPRTAPTSGNPATAGIPLDELARTLHRFLSSELPQAREIVLENLQVLPGGASREAWIFDVRWQDADGTRFEECILMREPVASVLVSDESADVINGTRRTVANEIRVIRAMEATGLPVPTVLWHDPEGAWLERPFSIARRLPGTADASGLAGSAHTAAIVDQYIEILARLHRLSPEAAGVTFLGTPTAETAALAQVLQFEHNFEAQRLEAFPATTYLIRWLKKHAPRAGRVSVVHGDYRLGNFLYEDDRIVAILDWEQVHIGDPLEEIAFMYWSLWSLEPFCPIETFITRYETATGEPVDREALAYYRVFIEFKMLVVLFTGLKSFFATPDRQLHYGGGQTLEMIRDAELRVIESLLAGGPTVAFDAYQKATG